MKWRLEENKFMDRYVPTGPYQCCSMDRWLTLTAIPKVDLINTEILPN